MPATDTNTGTDTLRHVEARKDARHTPENTRNDNKQQTRENKGVPDQVVVLIIPDRHHGSGKRSLYLMPFKVRKDRVAQHTLPQRLSLPDEVVL